MLGGWERVICWVDGRETADRLGLSRAVQYVPWERTSASDAVGGSFGTAAYHTVDTNIKKAHSHFNTCI